MSETKTRECATSLASELLPSELERLREVVRERAANGGRILEIGTAAGGTFVELVAAVKEVEGASEASFTVVDTFEYFTDHLETWKGNLRAHGLDPDAVDIRQGTSTEVFASSAGNADEKFSFILVDASHQLKNMIRDIRWLERLEVGGVAAFHDHSEVFPGVEIAVRTLLKRRDRYRKQELVDTLLFVEKIGECDGPEVSGATIALRTAHSRLLSWKRSAMKRLMKLGFFKGRTLIEA